MQRRSGLVAASDSEEATGRARFAVASLIQPVARKHYATGQAVGTAARRIPEANHKPMTAQPT